MAVVGTLAVETIEETETGFIAYYPIEAFDEAALVEAIAAYPESNATYKTLEIAGENWNKAWESNYDPIQVGERLRIRASFHEPAPTGVIDIVVDPKTSFGTGHHSTTQLMAQAMLGFDFQGKVVLDAGTGTGILAILAEKLGAAEVLGYDIEDWTVDNAEQNAALNQCQCTRFWLGDVSSIPETLQVDFILANINRNVLTADIPYFIRYLRRESFLMLSGFYQADVAAISAVAAELGAPVQVFTQHDWTALVFQRG